MTYHDVGLPKHIEDPEKIVKVIFSPINLTNNKQNIRSSAYKSPWGKDEVSVLRLDFCSSSICKQHGKAIANPGKLRTYFGLSLLTAKEIRCADADVVYTPRDKNNYHSDIKIGYISERGVQLPAEYQYKVDEMTKSAKFYADPNTDSNEWKGDELV